MGNNKKHEKNNNSKNKGNKISDETVVFKPITEEQLKKANKKGNKDKKKKGKNSVIKKVLKIVLILFLLLVIIGIAVVVAIFKTDRWAIDKDQFMSDKGATIYDKDGNEIIKLTGDEINKKLNLDEMGYLPDAFVSIEDERFYEHGGIDIKRTLHAIFQYIITGGKSSFGGSTITQQLVKITMNDNERSGFAIQRKVREWSRAVSLEKMFTKDEILQRYLNRIYLGSSSGLEIRGVESAANYYFNKSAKDLSIAEAAFIAGINHSPNNYNVFTSSTDISDKVKKRTLTVINKMYELGKITKEENDTATEEVNNGLNFSQGSVSNGKSELSYHAAAAINQIANEISERDDIKYSEAREMLINSGYNIYTTVDPSVQSKMEEVMQNSKYILTGSNPKNKNEDHKGQSAMVVIEPSTGYVVGEVGGLGSDQDTLGLNRGTSKRQAGSSFKPLATVAPGLETGTITASTLFYDVKTTFGKNYTVGSSNHGIEDMRTILTKSCNVPEIKLLSIMGIDKSTAFLESIGIDASTSDAGLSMALGTVDVSPLQMAAGFAMIANGGVYIEPTFYTKVTDASGKTIIEASQESNRVMTEQNAYIEEDLLTGPVKNGTAKSFNGYLGKMNVAGKTGTTNDNIDRWFCGMTPYYAAACWYGNDNNNGQFATKNPAATVWFDCMKSIHSGLEAKSFNKPDGIVTVEICKATGKKATDKCKDTYSEIFAKDHIPEDCDGHTSVKICKESRKIATEYCPDTETKAFGVLIDTEKDAKWSPAQKVEKAPTETCDIHTSAPEVDVPNVVGKNEDEAKKALTSAGFKVEVAKDQDPSKTKGIVLKQSATKSAKGGTITITVNQYEGSSSNDKKVIKIPDEDETDVDEKDNKDSKNSS